MDWLLDVHFREDQTGVFDMNVQKVLNTARKVTLNMLRLSRDANCRKSTPLSGIMRNNLFDFEHLGAFLDFFT